MIGAIAGDIIGSIYEMDNIKTTDFPLFTDEKHFTDDTVLTIATIDKILNNGSYVEAYQRYARRFPDAGYGKMFKAWFASDNPQPYNSFANGSAMRVSPIGLTPNSFIKTLGEAQKSSEVTHNHQEAINAAQCAAAMVWFANRPENDRRTKDAMAHSMKSDFGYDMDFDLMEVKKTYKHDVTAKGTMPIALKAFLDSKDYEDCIRLAVSIGGDTDTIACIAGGIAEAYYREIPKYIIYETMKRLPKDFQELLLKFYATTKLKTLEHYGTHIPTSPAGLLHGSIWRDEHGVLTVIS